MAEDLNVRVQPTPVNPVEIKGAIAFSAEHARVWAEGTDEEVEQLGGEHSAKGWADAVEESSHEYTDQQIAIARSEFTVQINSAVDNSVNVAKGYADDLVSEEADLRTAADNSLQTQIDALSAASDVTDIVGTYAELQAYDTSKLKDNDIIKVLEDSTHSNASSYYRWDKETETFSYIGSEGPYYTKSETDSKFLTQTDASSTYATQSSLASKQDALVSGTNIKTINSTSLLGSGNISVQDTLVSGTNIKTVNSQSLLGSGNIDISAGLPSQTGNSGKFLTTDGTAASWATVDALPSQTSQSGKFLTTNGTTASWDNIPTELPSQTGNSGKFLTTNGTTASWATVDSGIPTLTWYTGNTGTTVTIASTASAHLVKIYKNGILLEPTADYSISGTTLTLVTALVSTDKITLEVL